MSSTIISGRSAITRFAPKQHFELGEALGQMDFETAAKLSGARFVVLKSGLRGWNARSANSCSICIRREHGYTEVNPPLLVRDETMFGTAQLPKFDDDQFLRRERLPARNCYSDALKYAADRKIRRSFATEARFRVTSRSNRSSGAREGGFLAHSHRRSPAHQPRSRIDPRRQPCCPCGSPPARRASAPRRARRARTPAA